MALISDFWAVDQKGRNLQNKNMVENIIISNRVAFDEARVTKINIYEGLMGTVGQGCATVIDRRLAELFLKCNIDWRMII